MNRVLSAIVMLEMRAIKAEREALALKQKYEPTRERMAVSGASSIVHGGLGIRAAPAPVTTSEIVHKRMDGPPADVGVWPPMFDVYVVPPSQD